MSIVFNTGETNESLRKEYNPDGSLLRQVQLRMLDMLLYIDKICSEEHIEYRIDGGNVLGAVRHGGFIPWDDDIDIALPLKDYYRLCSYLKKHPHDRYVLQDNTTDNEYRFWSTLRDTNSEYVQDSREHNNKRYRGLQVDIFPFETNVVPFLNKVSWKITGVNLKYFVGRNNWVAQQVYNLQKNVIHPFFRLIGKVIGDSNLCSHSYGTQFWFSFPKDIVYPLKRISFEGYMFPAPNDVVKYLKQQYNDYMALPPREARNHHKAEYRIW